MFDFFTVSFQKKQLIFESCYDLKFGDMINKEL